MLPKKYSGFWRKVRIMVLRYEARRIKFPSEPTDATYNYILEVYVGEDHALIKMYREALSAAITERHLARMAKCGTREDVMPSIFTAAKVQLERTKWPKKEKREKDPYSYDLFNPPKAPSS